MLIKTNKTNNHTYKYKDKRQMHSKTCQRKATNHKYKYKDIEKYGREKNI